MAIYLILGGYGEIGRVIAYDLFETTRDTIIIAGHDAKKAREFAQSFKNPRVKWKEMDVTNQPQLVKLLRGKSICINSTNYYFNLAVMKACLKTRTHYIDLGGLFHMTKKQLKLHRKFKKTGVLAILGCGATPGITNIMASYGARLFDHVQEIHVKFAGKDFTKRKMPFTLPYSAQTLLDEFSMPAAEIHKGKLHIVPAISNEEKETFPQPIGEAVCGALLHSEIATFPLSFKGLRECTFKGSFEDEFIKFFKILVTQGFAKEPYRSWTVEFLNKFLPAPKTKFRDIEILRVTILGKKNGRRKKVVVDCHSKSINRWHAAAGTVDTAVPPSIIAQMIVSGLITKPGVFPPEQCVQPKLFFKNLLKRGIQVQIKHF